MVSNRNFFSIVIMMAVLLFLFQFTMIMKDRSNQYDVNDSLSGTQGVVQSWELKTVSLDDAKEYEGNFVLYVGRESSDYESIIKQWCTYTKRNLAECRNLLECQDAEASPKVVILESDRLSSEEIEYIRKLTDRGSTVVFENVDDVPEMEENAELCELLGISSVQEEETEVLGMKIFEGFLLGGEVIYQPEDEEEWEKWQDLDFTMPWYRLGSGTKSYVVGLFGADTTIKNEELPVVVWRHHVGNGNIFAVNGDYLKSVTGIGFLDGMMAENGEYEIYPVVNAQNLSVVNFPGFADENREVLESLYSRDMRGLYRDIIWPGLVAIADQNKWKMTCFVTPQFDYMDENEPQGDELTFYLKQLKEVGAEAGFSLDYTIGVSLGDKVSRDEKFFVGQNSNYLYGAVFVKQGKISNVLSMSDRPLLQNVRTIVCEYTEKKPVLEYSGDTVLLQMITNDGASHTYSDDLRMRSLQSALGYTNIMLDMRKVSWPEDEDDGWENVYNDFSSNLNTYWKTYSYFTKTTLSQSYKNATALLNMDYEVEKAENELTLKINGDAENYWFVLRTQDDEIEDVEGGSFSEIENNAYLIQTEQNEVKIHLKQGGLYYYMTE